MQRLVLQTQLHKRGEKPLLTCLSIPGAVQWKPFQRGLHASLLKGPIPLSHTSILLCARISSFPLEESDKTPPNFFKGFFATASLLCHMCAPLPLDCPDQGHRQNPSSHLDCSQEQPILYDAMAGK